MVILNQGGWILAICSLYISLSVNYRQFTDEGYQEIMAYIHTVQTSNMRYTLEYKERGKAGGHEPPLFPLPCHILAFFSSGSHEPPLFPLSYHHR